LQEKSRGEQVEGGVAHGLEDPNRCGLKHLAIGQDIGQQDDIVLRDQTARQGADQVARFLRRRRTIHQHLGRQAIGGVWQLLHVRAIGADADQGLAAKSRLVVGQHGRCRGGGGQHA
jgi:hypothetical protein